MCKQIAFWFKHWTVKVYRDIAFHYVKQNTICLYIYKFPMNLIFFTDVDNSRFYEMNSSNPRHWLGSESHKGSMEYGEELIPRNPNPAPPRRIPHHHLPPRPPRPLLQKTLTNAPLQ